MPARVGLRGLDRLDESHAAQRPRRRRGKCVGMKEEAEDRVERPLTAEVNEPLAGAKEVEAAACAKRRHRHARVAQLIGDRPPLREARDFDLDAAAKGAITSFSNRPLIYIFYLGTAVMLLSLVAALSAVPVTSRRCRWCWPRPAAASPTWAGSTR